MKKLIATLITICLITFSFGNIAFAQQDEITVTVNGEQVVFDQKPFLENDRTLVPIRAIAEKMQFQVDWNESTQEITLSNINTVLKLRIDDYSIQKILKFASDTYEQKISNINLDVPARIIQDRTFIPLRAISELFGATVNWKENTNNADIIYNNTYGTPISIVDDGIEHLCRIAITLNNIDTSNIENIDKDINMSIANNTLELYNGPLYEGLINNITTLGINNVFYFFRDKVPTVYSLEDLKKFPNLENIYLLANNIKDLSPLTYKHSWNEINLFQNPIYNFESLKDIEIKHFIYTGYYSYQFSYINESYNGNNTVVSDSEKEEYILFAKTLAEIFSTMQNVIEDRITPEMSRREKIEVINDWIIHNIRYDYNSEYFNNAQFYCATDTNYYNVDVHEIECGVLHGYAICEGYSKIFEVFCDMLDIPCIKISGFVTTSVDSHGWNIVLLEDNQLYHVDTTWNTNNNPKYLLIDSQTMKEDHFWDEEDIPLIFETKSQTTPFLINPLI